MTNDAVATETGPADWGDIAADESPELPGQAEQVQGPAPESRSADDNDPEADNFSRQYNSYGNKVDYEQYDESWKPPGLLDAPEPRPGFVQRWVAVEIGGSPNALNLSRRIQEKWRPRDPSTVSNDIRPPTISHGAYVGCIGVESMVLMERPKVIHEGARKRIEEATRRQMSVVKSDMREEESPGDRAQGFHNIQDRSERRVSSGGKIMPAGDDD